MGVEGVGLDTWALDILHSWHLGPLPRMNGKIAWFIIRSNAFQVNLPWLFSDDNMQLQLNTYRAKLFIHYKMMARDVARWSHASAAVWNATFNMMGPESSPCFHTKANETVHMLDFGVALLEEYAGALEAYDHSTFRFLLATAKAAQEFNRIIRESPHDMTRAMSIAFGHLHASC